MDQMFTNFFNQWMSKIYDCFQILTNGDVSHEIIHNQYSIEEIVNKVTTLHKEYYTMKWAAAHEDVLAFFTPVWLTPIENAHQWVTGWKPSTVLRLIEALQKPSSPRWRLELSEVQVGKMQKLSMKINGEEAMVERAMERLQVAIADPRMVELVRIRRRQMAAEVAAAVAVKDGPLEDAAAEEVLFKTVQAMNGLEKVMKMADCTRLKTLKGILNVLSPGQSVDFLAAFSMMLIVLTKWGKDKLKIKIES